MALLNDATLLAALKAAGAEEFDTGYPEALFATFDDDYQESSPGVFTVVGRSKVLRCRTADIATHRLVKGSALKRAADGVTMTVRELRADAAGLTALVVAS